MSARKPSIVPVEHAARSAYFYGPSKLVMGAIRAAGCAYQWDHTRRAVGVPIQCAGDVEARIVADGHVVQLRAVLR